MRFRVRLRGRGRVQVPAHGVAHAEAVVEKELHRLWPQGRVQIAEISRTSELPRIVEEFAIHYLVEGTLEVVAPGPADAPGAAFRRVRGYLAEGRYRRTEWEAVEVVAESQ